MKCQNLANHSKQYISRAIPLSPFPSTQEMTRSQILCILTLKSCQHTYVLDHNHSMSFSRLHVHCVFSLFFLCVCFLLDSFSFRIIKCTNLSFCNVSSAINLIHCGCSFLLNLRHSFQLQIFYIGLFFCFSGHIFLFYIPFFLHIWNTDILMFCQLILTFTLVLNQLQLIDFFFLLWIAIFCFFVC